MVFRSLYWNGASWDSSSYGHIVYSNLGVEYFGYEWDGAAWLLVEYCTANYNPFAGISEIENNSYISLYPNPINTETSLHISNYNGELLSLEMYDVQGKKVSEVKVNSEFTKIARGNLNSGIYFYKLIDDTKYIYTGKFIVE